MPSFKQLIKNGLSSLKKIDLCTRICLILAIITIIIILLNKLPKIENFTNSTGNIQTEKYITKKNIHIYDDFYANIYDILVHSNTKNQFEISGLQEKAHLNNKSIILDVGSGTGRHCSLLEQLGCNCTGIDTSNAMIKKAKENAPKSKFINENVLSSMTFNPSTFTHITVFYFTIYYIKDKLQFFKNAFKWLMPGGYLIIHLVNKHKFDPIVPAGDPLIMLSAQNYSKKRITSTTVSFDQFKYKANFKILKDNNNIANFDEHFIFPNGNIRHNQHVLWMDDQEKILGLAKDIGFILNAKIDLSQCRYDRQFLYVLQKPN